MTYLKAHCHPECITAISEIVTWEIAANQNTAFNKGTVAKQKEKRTKSLG